MATEKLSTEEILALARRQGAFGVEGGAAAEAPASEPPAESAAAQPESETPPPVSPKPRAAPPSSTADILAAARAQGGGAAPGKAVEPGSAPSKPAAEKPAAAPKSTADILAAARSQGGGATAKPAAAKPKAAATVKAKPAAASAATGEQPSVQEMVRVMHGQESAPAGAPVAPARPKLPGKPPLPKKSEAPISRRAALGGAVAAFLAILLSPFALGWAMMAVIGGLWSLLGARFMMPNIVVELPSKFKVGPPSDFPPAAVSTKFKASRGIWIVNSTAYNGQQLIYALYSVCTHLGCTPNWLEGEQKFKCPCHGSGFYISGINFEGPAPRPLERAGIRLAEDGSLEVDKSVKFQEELGQWQDPKSFYQV